MRLYEFNKVIDIPNKIIEIENKMKESLMKTKFFINHFKEVSNDTEFDENRKTFNRK